MALRWTTFFPILSASALLGSCFLGNEGIQPPQEALYFPTGLVVSPGRTTLYVANSDFDLQYNGGTVQAIELGGGAGLRDKARAVKAALANDIATDDSCRAVGLTPNPRRVLYPGPCAPIKLSPFVRDVSTIGAFASALSLVQRNDGQPGMRLFATVRGDPSVTYFDVPDDRTSPPFSPPACEGKAFCVACDGEGEEKRCSASHRIGQNPQTNQRGLVLATEPSGMDRQELGVAGDALVIAHQTEARASLIVNRFPGTDPIGPTLEFTITELPNGPTGVSAIPVPRAATAEGSPYFYRPGFLVTHRAAPEISLLRYEDDARSQPDRPFLTRTGSIPVTLGTSSTDQRGITIDATARNACESACTGEGDTLFACLTDCLDTPLGVYVISRAPSSLLVGEIRGEVLGEAPETQSLSDVIRLTSLVPLPLGASNVSVGQIVNPNGELETRIFTVSFDSRFISVYDPLLGKIERSIRTGRGPFGIAFDAGTDDNGEVEAYLYVGHFTDSYLSVVDLDQRKASYGEVLVSAGPPVAPREEQ